MGRNTIFWSVSEPKNVQPAEIGGNLLLQHEPHSTRVVKYVGHPWGPLQPGIMTSVSFGLT